MEEKVYLSQEGFDKIQTELNYLQGTKRREITEAIKVAREHGDLSENAEYDAAKEEQAKLELRIQQLQTQLGNAQIIDKSNIPEGKVSVGQRVKVKDKNTDAEFEYTLVVPAEADFDAGKLSVTSPIGKGLVGHEVGDVVEIRIPAGIKKYEILTIEIA